MEMYGSTLPVELIHQSLERSEVNQLGSGVRVSSCRAVVYAVIVSLLVTCGGQVIGDCPHVCRCLDKGSIMTCRRTNLVHVPFLLPTTMALDLDHNHVSVVLNNSFHDVPRLEILSMEDNGILYIESGSFILLPEMRIIRLGINRLSNLPKNIFWNNRNLEVLDLHRNYFTMIPDYIMYHLHSLKILNISSNLLTSPHLGPGFKYTTQLSSLDLSSNEFVSLESEVFKSTQFWDEQGSHYLNLSYCGIQHIHPHAFRQLSRLESLSLEGNAKISQSDLQAALQDLEVSSLEIINLSQLNITNISAFFKRFQHRNLVELYLSENHVHTIEMRTFYYLVNLRVLDLSRNVIHTIQDLAGLTKLESLNIAFNRLTYLDATAFEGLQSLQHLDVSHNALVRVTDAPFLTLFDLRSLDVSFNRISDFTLSGGMESLENLNARSNGLTVIKFVKRLLRLHTLDVSQNAITNLGADLFGRGQGYTSVNLSGNAIHDIHRFAFRGSSQELLDLSRNRLSSLSNLGWQRVRSLYLHGNTLYNLTANTFKGLDSLQQLNLENNNLYAFPHGTFLDLYNLRLLDLSNNPLGMYLVLPDAADMINGLNKLEILHLSHVKLERLSTTMLTNMTALRSLYLDGNELREIAGDALSHLPRLSLLNLSNNKLATVSHTTFPAAKKLHHLDLSGNPFDCTCDLMPLRRWLFSKNVTISFLNNQTLYRCASPPEWQGVPLVEFHLESTTCSSHEKAVIFTAVGCTILAVILAITIAVLRYRWWNRHKLASTQYSVIDNCNSSTSTVAINPHSREWV